MYNPPFGMGRPAPNLTFSFRAVHFHHFAFIVVFCHGYVTYPPTLLFGICIEIVNVLTMSIVWDLY
jgi:hypothetical protein